MRRCWHCDEQHDKLTIVSLHAPTWTGAMMGKHINLCDTCMDGEDGRDGYRTSPDVRVHGVVTEMGI